MSVVSSFRQRPQGLGIILICVRDLLSCHMPNGINEPVLSLGFFPKHFPGLQIAMAYHIGTALGLYPETWVLKSQRSLCLVNAVILQASDLRTKYCFKIHKVKQILLHGRISDTSYPSWWTLQKISEKINFVTRFNHSIFKTTFIQEFCCYEIQISKSERIKVIRTGLIYWQQFWVERRSSWLLMNRYLLPARTPPDEKCE